MKYGGGVIFYHTVSTLPYSIYSTIQSLFYHTVSTLSYSLFSIISWSRHLRFHHYLVNFTSHHQKGSWHRVLLVTWFLLNVRVFPSYLCHVEWPLTCNALVPTKLSNRTGKYWCYVRSHSALLNLWCVKSFMRKCWCAELAYFQIFRNCLFRLSYYFKVELLEGDYLGLTDYRELFILAYLWHRCVKNRLVFTLFF